MTVGDRSPGSASLPYPPDTPGENLSTRQTELHAGPSPLLDSEERRSVVLAGGSTVVVLGGSGFVGRHLVNQLVASGFRVVVPTRRRESAKHLIVLPTVEVIETDIHADGVLEKLFAGTTGVINLIGLLNEGRRETFASVHVGLARRIVAACNAVGVLRVLQMSALNADPKGPSAYLRSKGEAEAVLTSSKLAWTIFQPSVIFGREDSFLNLFAMLQRLMPVIPLAAADVRFQPVYVGDVVRAMSQSLPNDETHGKRYPLCGPKVYTLAEIVRYVGELSGHRRPILPLGSGLSQLQARMLELLPGKLMSRDNLASMKQDSVCSAEFPRLFGIEPTALEAIAPSYLTPASLHGRFDRVRTHSGR
jgi:uncharacterized protein YbjT (DUF2867 family)